MAVNIALLVITLAGPLAVAGAGVAAGCPRLAVVQGMVTAIYIGVESSDPFYTTLVWALVALVGMAVAVRTSFMIVGR